MKKKGIEEYVVFKRNPYSSEDELRLNATDAQLRQMSRKDLNRLLAIGLRGNDYKRVLMHAKSK